MKRAFTLIEMLIACSISAFMVAAIVGMLSAVWLLAKDSSDELQGALRARSVRERLYYNIESDEDGQTYGLINATNIISDAQELLAQFRGGKTISIRAEHPTDVLVSELDHTRPPSDYREADDALQFVYLAIATSARTTYRDRLVVPVFGRAQKSGEMGECFGE